MNPPPACLDLAPIDEHARDGGFHAVFRDGAFAVARWRDQAWEFASGVPLDFTPTHYSTRGKDRA